MMSGKELTLYKLNKRLKNQDILSATEAEVMLATHMKSFENMNFKASGAEASNPSPLLRADNNDLTSPP